MRHLLHDPRALVTGPSLAIALAACSAPAGKVAADSAAAAAARADSLARAAAADAPAFRDSAKATLSQLLQDPRTAVFDSVMVIQPPAANGRLPTMVVCGRISGKPGIGGRQKVRFIYQAKFTVFVEDPGNRQPFAELWGRTCAATGATVVLQG